MLKDCNFGFVHQVLTYSRLHEASTTSSGSEMNRLILESMMLLEEFGPVFLSPHDHEKRRSRRMKKYYRFLASQMRPRKNDKKFWLFHLEGLKEIGIDIDERKMARMAAGHRLSLLKRNAEQLFSR